MSRGRKAIEIDRTQFQTVITSIEEGSNPPTNRSQLWKLVAATPWARELQPRALSAQVAMLKAEALGLHISTPKGQRGRSKGDGPVANAGQRRRRNVSKGDFTQMQVQYGVLGDKTLEKLRTGNIRTAVKVMCFDCCGGSKKEVSLCQIRTCPLWIHRPWQGKKANADSGTGRITLETVEA